MKKLLTTIFAVSTLFIFAQTPQGINYQSIIRNTGGIVLPNTTVNMEFKLYNGLAGALLYDESHSATTNSFGMVNLIIGQGSPVSGTFNTITWSNGIAYEVYVNSTLIGTKQLFMSVPYALNAGSAPAPTVSYTNNILSVGGNTTALPSGITYTAGNGIDITGSVITSTANIVGVGATTVTGIYPNLTINTPTVQPYSAGNGIDITGGVITNIAPPATPYTLTTNSNTITINNGSSVSTATVPSYSAGNGINVSSTGVITNTASSTNLPAAFNGQFIYFNGSIWDTIPRDNIYFDGTNFGIGTQSPAANFHVAGYGRFDASISTPQIYTDNIKITGGTNAQVLTSDAIGNGTWQALPNYSLTQSGSNINLTQNGTSVATVSLTAATSTSLMAGSSNILLNQSGNAYTITPVTPTFANAGPTTITGTYPNYTVNSVATASTTLVQGNNISLNQSGNTYTVSTPGYSISLPGGNTVQITNGTSTSTAAIASTSLTLAGVNNTILSAGGNAVSLNTYSAGTGISVSGTAPNFVITNTATAITQSLTGTGISSVIPAANSFTVNTPMPTYTPTTGVLSFGGTNTVVATPSLSILGNVLRSGPSTNTLTLPPPFITGTGTGIATVTTAINNFTVNVPTPTYAPGAGVLSFGGTNIVVTPTLALTGTTLSSGAITNSVNLSSLSVWSNSVGVLYPTTLTNSVAVGTSGPTTGKFEILHTATQANPTMHLRESTGGLNRIKFSNNIVANKFFETAAQTNAVDANGAYSINHHDGITYRPILIVYGDNKVAIHNMNTALASLHVMDTSKTTNGIASEGFAQAGSMIIARNNQPGFGSRLSISANDEIGKLSFSGYGGSSYGNGPKISAKAIENFTGSANGSEMIFSTVPAGSIASQDVLKLTNDGKVEIVKTLFVPSTASINIPLGAANGKVLTSDNFGNASWQTVIATLAPWIQGPGMVTLNNINDKVGIGTATPTAQLHVFGSTDPLQIAVENTGGAFKTGFKIKTFSQEWFIGRESGGSNGLRFSDITNGRVSMVIETSGNVGIGTTAPTANLQVVNIGTVSPAAIFDITDTNNTNNTIEVYNSGIGTSIFATNTSSTNATANINNTGGGMALNVVNTSNSDPTAYISNNGSYRALDAYSASGTAVFAQSNGFNHAIQSTNYGTGNSIDAFKSNTTSAGSVANFANASGSNPDPVLNVTNEGTGPSIKVVKNTGTTVGNVGRFENNSTSNFADAVFVINSGGGAAIHAVSGPTVAGGSNTSVLIEEGHIDIKQVLTGTSVGSIDPVTIGFAGSNDVIGTTKTFGVINVASTASANPINITFGKSYKSAPVVVITANSDLASKFSVWVTSTVTGFTINYKNNTAALISIPTSTQLFSYHVIGTN